MSNTRIYWLHALSPTHAGIGRGVGYIDLPIDRDGITGWPIIRGSAFKGVWADYYAQHETEKDREKNNLLRAAFGFAGGDNNSNAGALIPTDARLVCLPIRSFRGTFAWCTSPLCLQMLRRTLELAGLKQLPAAPSSLLDHVAHYAVNEEKQTALKEGDRIYLEDLDFEAQECATASAWASAIGRWVFPAKDDPWQKEFQKRFVVLPDVAFDFLCETGTEVHTRVKINADTKTVENGALWTEESLPTETILAGLVQCERVFLRNGARDESICPERLVESFASRPLALQIGGKATVGRGQMCCVFSPVTGGGQ